MPHFLPTPRNESERVRLECLFYHMYEVSSSFASILSTLRTDTTPHRALTEFSLYKRILMAYKIHDDTHASTHSAVLCSSDFLTKLLWSTRALLMHKQIRQKFKSIHTKAELQIMCLCFYVVSHVQYHGLRCSSNHSRFESGRGGYVNEDYSAIQFQLETSQLIVWANFYKITHHKKRAWLSARKNGL